MITGGNGVKVIFIKNKNNMSYSSRIKKTINGATQEQHLVFEHLKDAIEHAKTTGCEVNIYDNNNDQLIHVEAAPAVEPVAEPVVESKPVVEPAVESIKKVISTDKVATSKQK